MTEKLVVVGAGMASGRVLEHLLDDAPGRYDITLFGAEPRGNYNRIMLSPVLSGEKTYDEIVTHDAAWYARHGITTRFGETVTKIDRGGEGRAREGRRDALRPALDRHRLGALHHPGARPRAHRRHGLPRPRRRPRDDGGRRDARRQGRGHRRRPARPRGGGGAQGARHGGHRPAPDGPPDGAPARPGRRLPPAEGSRAPRHPRPLQGLDQGDPRPRARRRGAARGRHRVSGRHRGDGRRHPPRDPHRHRRPSRGQPRHRRRRRACRPPTSTSSPSASASSTTAPATASSRRSTTWRRSRRRRSSASRRHSGRSRPRPSSR